MALPLPTVLSPVECAEYGRVVSPFFLQLTTLPARFLDAGTNLDALKELYISTNPMVMAIGFALALVPIFVITAEINRNYSQVDRVWSILPSVYNAHFALWARLAGLPTKRIDTVALWCLFWSVRLTFNYWRRGGYQIGSEDYRWEYVRARVKGRALFFIFNVIFISFTQSILLCLVTAPTYLFLNLSQLPESTTEVGGNSFTIADLIFSRLLIFYVFIEIIADEQQWRYQSAKYEWRDSADKSVVPAKWEGKYTVDDLKRGFNVSGLWSYCRHPNFAAEQAIWVTMYAWAAYDTNSYLNWTIVGAILYLGIFQGSTPITEGISAGKYPEYKEYQARVGRFIPRFSLEPRHQKSSSSSKENKKKKKKKN